MTIVRTKLFQILLGNSSFCNLCYNDIETLEKSYFIKDEVALENETKVLGDLMCSVLGMETIPFCVSGIICEACTRRLISLYNFIIMCKQNTLNLYNCVASLEGCLFETVTDSYVFQSLFISLNQDDYSCKQYYDCKSSFNNTSKAFIHFQKILATEQTKIAGYDDIIEVKEDLDPGGQNYEEFNDSVDTGLPNDKKKKTKIKNSEKDTTEKKIKLKTLKVKNKKNSMHIATKDMLLHENYDTIIKCKVCLKIFLKTQNLRQHYIQVHAPKTFKCTECVSSFGSASFLASHMSSCHKPSVCPECGKVYFCRSVFYQHRQSHKAKHICERCGKEFKYKHNYNRHIDLKKCDETHKRSVKQKYTCDYCCKAFICKAALRTHIRYQHGFSKGHQCILCKKIFPAPSKLKSHSVVHTKEKNFNCEICGKSFVTKDSLLFHTRLHSGERPYSCEYCDLRFLSSSRRTVHVNQYHLPPKFECDICQKKFAVKACLTRHKKLHSDPKSKLHMTGATVQHQ